MLALALTLAAPAQAAGRRDDPDVPARDPRGHWRQMTLDDATTDSKCVGTFDTPVCAVETVIACFARSQRALCNEALDKPGYFPEDQLPPSKRFTRMLYRFAWTQRLTQAAIKEIPRAAHRERPGDIRIDVIRRTCMLYDGKESCETAIPPDYEFAANIFTLQKSGDRWFVVDWSIRDYRWPKKK